MPGAVRTITLLTGLVITGSALAQSYTKDDVERLQQDCYQQRQVHIAPLKQEEIQRCVDKGEHDLAWCENDLQTFGEASGRRPGMFWDIPACELSFDVERYFQRNPGKKSYTPE